MKKSHQIFHWILKRSNDQPFFVEEIREALGFEGRLNQKHVSRYLRRLVEKGHIRSVGWGMYAKAASLKEIDLGDDE
jgi:hypothetical protein